MALSKKFLRLLVLLLGLGNLWTTLHRSAIPIGLRGTVSSIELRNEKHPGKDDVYLAWLGKRAVHLDTPIAEALRPGDRISKRPWETRLETPRGRLPLSVSQDFRGMAALMPLLLLLGIFL